jgi:hypothetical protein
MPRGTFLTPEEKTTLDALHAAKWSLHSMAKHIKRSRNAIRSYLKNPSKYGPKKRKATNKKLSETAKRRIVREASTTKKSCQRLVETLELPVTRQRVFQILKASTTLTHVKGKKAPLLTSAHKIARLIWAKTYFQYGSKWFNVIFSDEKKFNLDGPDGWVGYWYDLRKEPEIFSRRQNGGGSVMVWAAFSWEGTSKLVILRGNQASQDYIRMLQLNMLEFNEQKHGSSALFQHDNASIHASRLTKEWLEAQEIPVMKWPARSPDLNPIENLWSFLARKVYEDSRQYSTILDLEKAIQRCWSLIPRSLIQKLILSMGDRCFEVAQANGGKIKY